MGNPDSLLSVRGGAEKRGQLACKCVLLRQVPPTGLEGGTVHTCAARLGRVHSVALMLGLCLVLFTNKAIFRKMHAGADQRPVTK